MTPIRLLLLDDHLLFREGLSRLLVTESDFEMVAQCGTPAEALEVLGRSAVDIVLLDYDLEDDTGTRFISAATASGYQGKILMVTAGMNELQCALAWKLGISGIALKHSSPASLLEAIRVVFEGGIWNHQKGEASSSSSLKRAPGLTPRERQVLRGILEGLTNKDIARQIGVSLSSVKGSLQQLFDKTGVRTRSQLVRIAIERSLEATLIN
ncbi:MAG TPA: response regulator transcription factor [Bryobacteraceae bacterium]|jgi:DNA-binding NarL/FixJ family response regulator|nr:response regulator transcription factor [Bryobacteraceae bacterium]